MWLSSTYFRTFLGVFGLFLALAGTPAHAGWFNDAAPPAQRIVAAQIPPSIDGLDLDVEALKAFYALRDHQPAWHIGGKDGRAGLIDSLRSLAAFVEAHGLFLAHDPIARLRGLAQSMAEQDNAKLELLFTDFLLRLAAALHGDAVDLTTLYPGWSSRGEPADRIAGLADAVGRNKVSDYLASLAPQNPAYRDLLAALKTYRGLAAQGEPQRIASGPALKPAMREPRVGQMRARLVAEGYAAASPDPAGNDVFDAALEQAVKTYQARNGLLPDGHAGARTVAVMNIPFSRRVEQIIANLERWRHMPEQMPPRAVTVNIAAAWLDYRENGQKVYDSSVIVGRPDRRTPFIQSEIRSVIFNPAWHVPSKIARKDILPKLRKDPHYLEKLGFVINGSADDPYGANIDWNRLKESAFDFRLRQSPGDMNSLGRLKFDFDNDFAVYMHGTPHPELFDKPERFFSSGCIRLHEPERFAEIVLSRNASAWNVESVKAEIDKGKTRWLKVADPLPLSVVYWTAFTAEDGAQHFRSDIYNYDQFLVETMRRASGGK